MTKLVHHDAQPDSESHPTLYLPEETRLDYIIIRHQYTSEHQDMQEHPAYQPDGISEVALRQHFYVYATVVTEQV